MTRGAESRERGRPRPQQRVLEKGVARASCPCSMVSLRSTGRDKRLLARGRADARPSPAARSAAHARSTGSARSARSNLECAAALRAAPLSCPRTSVCAGRGTAFPPRRARRVPRHCRSCRDCGPCGCHSAPGCHPAAVTPPPRKKSLRLRLTASQPTRGLRPHPGTLRSLFSAARAPPDRFAPS